MNAPRVIDFSCPYAERDGLVRSLEGHIVHLKIFVADPSFFTLPYDAHLCGALADQGHEVTLVGRPLRTGESAAAAGKARISQLFYRHAERLRGGASPALLFPFVKGMEHIADSLRFLKELKRLRPDVVHFQWAPLPLCDYHLVAAVRKIAPVVMTVHDTVPFRGHPTSTIQFTRWKETLARFDALIVHTAFSKANLCASGFPGEKIHVIPHGVFAHPAAAAPARPAGERKVLSFGEIKPYKGIDILLKAFAELPEELRNWTRVAVVGRPRMDVSPLIELAQSLGIAHRVDWNLSFVPEEDIPGIFAGADIAAFPYREIDASGALMTALPFGKPVVASALEPFLEVLGGSAGACTFPPGDHRALARVLEALLTDGGLYDSSALLSRELAQTRFSWAEIATATANLYEALRAERSRGRSE